MAKEEKKVTEEVPEEQAPENEETVDTPGEETAEEKTENAAADKKQADAQETKKEDEDLKTQLLRLSADFQNFRRRSEAEKKDIYAYANEKVFVQLLDVIDNFDRAMDTAPEGDKFAEGMNLILKQLLDVLNKNNVVEIEALGKDFDPMFHNAVMTEAAAEGQDANKVSKVLQKGYTLNGKVIRPAMVAVTQ